MKNKDCWGKPGVQSVYISTLAFCSTWAVWVVLGIDGKPVSSTDLGDGKTRYTEVQQASQKLCGHKKDVKGYKDISKISIVSSESHS